MVKVLLLFSKSKAFRLNLAWRAVKKYRKFGVGPFTYGICCLEFAWVIPHLNTVPFSSSFLIFFCFFLFYYLTREVNYVLIASFE
jgi:hypothetical protein